MSLTEKNIKKAFKEFNLEKGKKTGYYINTVENRKKGIVGQKYIKDKKNNIKPIIEINDERITISLKGKGSIVLTETIPEYEFVDDLTEEEFEDLNIDEDDFIYKIEHIEVEDKYKGKGIGKQLINIALKEAKSKGISDYIYLNASPMGFSGLNIEDLTSFYEKFGFKTFKEQGHNNLMLLKL